MLDNIRLLAMQIAVMFLLMAVGFVCSRLNYLNDTGAANLSVVLNRVVAPAVIIHSFERTFDPALAHDLVLSGLCAFLYALVAILLAHTVFRKGGAHQNFADKRFCLVFTNCGFMALPLLDALLGSYGLFLGSAFIVVNNLLLWSYGVDQLSQGAPEKAQHRLRNALVNPGTVSLAIGLVLFLTPFTLPSIPSQAVGYVASLNTPVAMLILGSFLAQCDLKSCFRGRDVYLVTGLRLLALPLIMLVLYRLLPLPHAVRQSLLISVSAPVAMAAPMFARMFGTDYLFSTRAVAVSTLLSAVTIPAMIALCG